MPITRHKKKPKYLKKHKKKLKQLQKKKVKNPIKYKLSKSLKLEQKSLDFIYYINTDLYSINDLLKLRTLNKRFKNSEYIKKCIEKYIYVKCPTCSENISYKKMIKFIKKFRQSDDRLNCIIPCKNCKKNENSNFYIFLTDNITKTTVYPHLNNKYIIFKQSIWHVFESRYKYLEYKCPHSFTCELNFIDKKSEYIHLDKDCMCSVHRRRNEFVNILDNLIRKRFIATEQLLKKKNEKNKFKYV
jgi:hypothetical protein